MVVCLKRNAPALEPFVINDKAIKRVSKTNSLVSLSLMILRRMNILRTFGTRHAAEYISYTL